jgi:hypothetical protein
MLGVGAAGVALAGPGTAAAALPSTPATRLRDRSFGSAGPAATVGPGAWCWFQSPRAALGPDDRLWLGTTVDGTDTERDGAVEVTAFHLGQQQIVEHHRLGRLAPDDHTSPAVQLFGARPQVAWATHTRRDWLEVGMVGQPLQRIRRPASLAGVGRGVSYASMHTVGSTRWLLYRGEEFSWNLLRSTDAGRTWRALGLVLAPSPRGQRPYLAAASDGARLHLLACDGNPTEYRGNRVGYATVQPDLSIRDNAGRKIGMVGASPPTVGALTRLFDGVAGADEAGDTDGWLCDVKLIEGRPTALLSVRDPWPPDAAAVGSWRHRYLWARQRGTGAWTVEHLAWAGSELYLRQPDYSGLAALDPTNAQRTVISTDVHPLDGTPLVSNADGLVHRELWEGFRVGEGEWTWTPLTEHSAHDHLRPVIASNGTRKALAWMQGSYRSWTDWSTQIMVRSV